MQRRIAWILILIVDISDIAWGFMAAAFPNQLTGPGGRPILAAGYEGFTKSSWADLVGSVPMAGQYMEVLFRTYGMYNVVFGVLGSAIAVTAFRRGERWAWWALLAGNVLALVSAMIYDKTVKAIGPFELTEYLGLAMVLAALAMTIPFRTSRAPVESMA